MLHTDLSMIDDPLARLHSAWPSFEKEMEGKAYGWEALHNAWEWFVAEWEARENLYNDKRSSGHETG